MRERGQLQVFVLTDPGGGTGRFGIELSLSSSHGGPPQSSTQAFGVLPLAQAIDRRA